MKCGGASAINQADEDIQKVCDKVRDDLEKVAGSKFAEFKALHYRSQVVAGTNYFVKIYVGNEKYVHARIYQHFSGTVELSDSKTNLSVDEELTYF